MKYRADIDGLRAIAVVSVILAHAGVRAVGGGFLGVDVFFAISGFLITTILLREMGEERYSILAFYERRARRILPALLVVLAACVPPALAFMLPDFLQNFGQSLVATLLFGNNLLLAKTSGYWDLESQFKPLLHTWSLGVEEQYYIVFPLLLVAIRQLGRPVQVAIIGALALLSLGIAEHGWRAYPDASFYLPTSRAWELMAGSLAAFVARRERALDPWFSGLGLLAIVGSMLVFTEDTPSPSLYAAVPVLGTIAVLLFNRPGTPAYRLLSLRPMVFVGLISYSAYLWHQPLFAFARIVQFDPPSGAEMAGLTLLTLALAWLTWKFVEQPFRTARTMPTRPFAIGMAGGTALLVGAGVFLHVAKGLPRWTFPNVAQASEVYIAYNERVQRYKRDDLPRDGKANVVIVGDSYGRDVANVLIEGGAAEGKNLAYVEGYPACAAPEYYPANAGFILGKADLIVLSVDRFGIECVNRIETLLRLHTAAPIVVVGSKQFGDNINPFGRVPMDRRSTVVARVPADQVVMNDAIAATLPPDRYIDLIRILGSNGRSIRFFDDAGNPLTPDRYHLTLFGARYVAGVLNQRRDPAWMAIRDARPLPPAAPAALTASPAT